MSGETKVRWRRLSIGDVATIGAPSWGIRLMRPSRHYGLFAEIDMPKHHFELRWHS